MVIKTIEDYAVQVKQLLPPGPAWDLDSNPQLKRYINAVAKTFYSIDKRSAELRTEMYPGTMLEMLADWELVMRLPDKCVGVSSTLGERRREVIRRFVTAGEQRPLYFVDIARRMGYPDAEVYEWRTPRFNRARFGRDRFGTWDCQHIWTLDLKARKVGGARFGLTVFGQRFGANLNDSIECIVRRYAPAHTVVFFKYV